MNTSKQVNVMIGLMFLVALFFAVNVINGANKLIEMKKLDGTNT